MQPGAQRERESWVNVSTYSISFDPVQVCMDDDVRVGHQLMQVSAYNVISLVVIAKGSAVKGGVELRVK